MSCEETQKANVCEKVPDFHTEALLPDGSFKTIKLSDYKGRWVVIFFYPLDFTFVCPTEIRSFEESYQEFKEARRRGSFG